MKILIYGSTYLTQLVVNKIKDSFDLVGYIPSLNPIFPGKIDLKKGVAEHHIALSIQYDQKLEDDNLTFNLHTGLLPEYGGCDILLHTLINQESYQGLTFHRITDKFDFGPIVSKITYPIFKNDTAVDLYERMCLLAPEFVENSLHLLEKIPIKYIQQCPSYQPTIYKRKNFDSEYQDIYKQSYNEIQQWIKRQS